MRAAFAHLVATAPTSVLFVCTYNAIRSPMAEAILKSRQRMRIFTDSAGVRPGETDPFTIAVMREIGIDLNRHRPKTLDELEDDSFDLVVTLSPEAHHRALEMTRTTACEVEYWPTLDPTFETGNRDARLAAFRGLRDTLLKAIDGRFGSAR